MFRISALPLAQKKILAPVIQIRCSTAGGTSQELQGEMGLLWFEWRILCLVIQTEVLMNSSLELILELIFEGMNAQQNFQTLCQFYDESYNSATVTKVCLNHPFSLVTSSNVSRKLGPSDSAQSICYLLLSAHQLWLCQVSY